MVKQQVSDGGHCVNAGVFQEYVSAARSVGVASARPYRCRLDESASTSSTHFCCNSESELEEVLTFYTQKNKSSTIFLGSQGRSVKEELCEGNGESSKSESVLCFQCHRITVTLGSVCVCVLCYHSRTVNGSCLGGLTNPPPPPSESFRKKASWCEGRVSFKRLSLTGGKQTCVCGEE